jgi:hypothetical protein
MEKYCFVNLNEIGPERMMIEVLYNFVDTEPLTEKQCIDLAFAFKRAVRSTFDSWREMYNKDKSLEFERTVYLDQGKKRIILTLIEPTKKTD